MHIFFDTCNRKIYDFSDNTKKTEKNEPNGLTFSEILVFYVIIFKLNLHFHS